MKSRYFMVAICISLLMGVTSCSSDDFEGYGPEEHISEIEGPKWLRTIKSVDGIQPDTRGVAVTDKLWEPGDTIRIKFLGGTLTDQNKVKQYADLWLGHANLVFKYVDISDEADVKINFNSNAAQWVAWSMIGTDCRLVAQDSASAVFFDFDVLSEEDMRGEVLRTFGHVLGLGFEHQNPVSPMQFNNEAVEYLTGEYGLTQAEAEELIVLYSTNQSNYTAFDKNSIMTIGIPTSILEGGRRAETTSWNTNLSVTDIAFISNLYPYPSRPGVLLNGVCWATCNVGAPGRFAATPESSGMFYQWNRRRGWLDDFTDWDLGDTGSSRWEVTNDPSPVGWRVPDTTDFNKLLDTTKVAHIPAILNNVNGLKFVDKASGNSIFLPFAGMLYPYTALFQAGTWGYYWSETPDSGMPNSHKDAWGFGCASGGGYIGASARYSGLSIRCVRDE